MEIKAFANHICHINIEIQGKKEKINIEITRMARFIASMPSHSPWFAYIVWQSGVRLLHEGLSFCYGLLMIMCLQQKMLTLIYFIMSNNLLETLGWKNEPAKQTR